MNNIAADIPISPPGGFTGAPGGKGLLANPGNGIDLFATFVSSTVGLMTIIAIVWFVFVFITGAIGIISAGSDKNALEGSRKKIVTGVIGLVVTIAAVFLINLIGYLLGFSNILDLTTMFNSLTK